MGFQEDWYSHEIEITARDIWRLLQKIKLEGAMLNYLLTKAWMDAQDEETLKANELEKIKSVLRQISASSTRKHA